MGLRNTLYVAAAVAVGTAVVGAGTASAMKPVQGDGGTGVSLTHDETVSAAQLHVGALIDVVYGGRWTASLGPGSKWEMGGAYTPVTGDQLVAEAAAHPDGRVAFGFADPTREMDHNGFWAVSAWTTGR